MTRKQKQIDENSEISKSDMIQSEFFKKLCQFASFGLFKVAKDIEEAEV